MKSIDLMILGLNCNFVVSYIYRNDPEVIQMNINRLNMGLSGESIEAVIKNILKNSVTKKKKVTCLAASRCHEITQGLF